MAKGFDREALLDAFDQIGEAAVAAGVRLEIAVYGGSALMLASNFRFATEDVDIGELQRPWPAWLTETAARIGEEHGWDQDWLNEGVVFHLSRLATVEADHVEFGTFPRSDDEAGLVVYVPNADYMLALKVKAIRMLDPAKGPKDTADIVNLMRVVGITTPEEAVKAMGRYFPKSAADPDKHLFLLRRILASDEASYAPAYPVRSF